MRIQHVEMVGFKSFLDKTRITFHDGISMVVGPNGCGKSNIVDAIRWVMGETSAKSLRGKEMVDVLFSGSEGRKPTSMAQVSLLFSCEDGVSPAGYDQVPEIEITRRLYRDGDSEYLINRTPCRLRDIQELLMDTGAGARAYSVIEQGQIAKVLSAKPTDRRFLIEDAAGTTKFRHRREETERKIESTRRDLERIWDLMTEIKRGVNSLARQAGRARRFRELSAEARAIDLELAAGEMAELEEREGESARLMKSLKDRIEAAQNRIATDETTLEARSLSQLKAAKSLEEDRRSLAKKNEEVHRDEAREAELRRKIAEETARLGAFEDEDRKAEESFPEQEEQALSAGRRAQEIAGLMEEVQGKLGEANEQRKRGLRDGEECRVAAEALRSRIHESEGKLASLEGMIEGYIGTHRREENRLAELSTSREDVRSRSGECRKTLEYLEKRRSKTAADLAALRDGVSCKAALLEELKIDEEKNRSALKSLQAEHESTQVQRALSEQMRGSLEGYSEGVRHLFAPKESPGDEDSRPEGLLGLLADVLRVDSRHEAALEAVLGERVQGVFVRGPQEGLHAVDFLKRSDAGRSTFIPLRARPSRAVYPESTLKKTRGPLFDLVEYPEEYAGAVGALLDDVLLVDDLQTAVGLHRENGYTGSYVTLDGELVDPYGVITGGSKKALSNGLIRNNRRVREITERIGLLVKDIESAEDAHAESTRRRDEAAQNLASAGEAEAKTLRALAECDVDLGRAGGEKQGLSGLSERVEEQIAQIRRELQEGRIRAGKAEAEAAVLQKKIGSDRRELARHEGTLSDLAARLEPWQEKVTKLTAELAGLREQRKAAVDLETRAHWALDRLREDRKKRVEAAEGARRKIEAVGEDLGKLETGLALKVRGAAELNERLNRVQDGLAREAETLSHDESALRLARKDQNILGQEMSRQEVAALELTMKKSHIAERLMDKYGIELSSVPRETERDESIDPAALQARRRELAEKLAAIGEVNLSAIDEHQEEKERLESYQKQKDDLEEAIDCLERAIAKINRESRERFLKTFHLVAEKFAQIIPSLFGGGVARLELTDPDHPLESGVEIYVRPPGKKLKNINLLSGGEKALTSIGLIFSIFLIKPSPFCLLDEVDAPLDDVNVDRFNELIRQIQRHSQVILITHNKRTMNIADTLYGVSMQEAGVSKLVSVHFGEDAGTDPSETRDKSATTMH